MDFLTRLLRPKAVNECLVALEMIRPLFSKVLFADTVLARVKSGIVSSDGKKAVVKSIIEAGNSPRDVVLFAVVQASKSFLGSGQYHTYRGVLNAEGSSIRAAFGIALAELVKSGFADEKQAEEQLAELAEEIKSVG